MYLKLATLGLLALVQLQSLEATQEPKTLCYYESWVHWRQGEGKMDPNEIDYKLCTHLAYSYFGIEAGTHELKVLDPYLMNDLHDMEKFVHAKGSSRALIAVGGASESTTFSSAARDPTTREAFVNSVVHFISRNGFDGIIIDWYGMAQSDSENLIHLLDKFDEKFASTPYTLAITLPVTQATLNYYNVPKIAQYVDFINVITFDYAGPWGKIVGHASPISMQLATLEEYHKRGAPRSKLLMSVPLFARTWKLKDNTKQEVGAEAVTGGAKGPYTQVEGLLSYNELCVLIKSNPTAFSLIRDPKEMAVHAIYNVGGGVLEWISFEDTKTLAAKAKNITEDGFAGMSVYTLSNEDVHGVCGKAYPLLHAINENYVRSAVTEPPRQVTIPPVVHVTTGPVVIPNGPFTCTKVGQFRDHTYCQKYYVCEQGEFGTLEMLEKNCDRTQAFDETTHSCVEKSKVAGC